MSLEQLPSRSSQPSPPGCCPLKLTWIHSVAVYSNFLSLCRGERRQLLLERDMKKIKELGLWFQSPLKQNLSWNLGVYFILMAAYIRTVFLLKVFVFFFFSLGVSNLPPRVYRRRLAGLSARVLCVYSCTSHPFDSFSTNVKRIHLNVLL